MDRFPHLKDTQFPDVSSVDVFKYENRLDYARFNYSQMKITVCTVPWDMGEAHIGNRTISGIGNVVFFETKEKRDEWFADIPDSECFRFETKYKELHRDNEIILPLPFDIAAKYNYVMVEYSLFANDDSPLEYEQQSGVQKWFWFIREVEFAAPNATKIHLMPDSWQQWIYDFKISGVVLERGHAPMFATDADEYLTNPIENSEYLLAPDVNFSEIGIVRDSESLIFNDGNMYAVIITSALVTGDWGSKTLVTWTVPGITSNYQQGAPSYMAFAVLVENLAGLLNYIQANIPQMVQTIKGIFFAEGGLIEFGNGFYIGETPCQLVEGSSATNELITLEKSKFGYDQRYADIAKLYTFPYAYIEVSDENGNVSIIRTEETTGTLKFEYSLNMLFPYVRLNGSILGVGNDTQVNYTFKNVTSHTFAGQGAWYRFIKQWDIPIFGLIQASSAHNDYATHFTRAQNAIAGNNAYASTTASADTDEANAYQIGDGMSANTQLQINSNSANASASNTQTLAMASNAVVYNDDTRGGANYVTNGTAISQIQATEAQAAIAATAGAASGVAGAIGSVATGDVAGAIGALVGGGISAASTLAQSSVSINLTNSLAQWAMYSNTRMSNAANDKSNNDANAGVALQNSLVATANALLAGSNANSVYVMKTNATRTKNTQAANAQRTLDTVYSANANQVANARLQEPLEFGTISNADIAASRPIGLFAQIVTQPDSAISQTGDEFLRYGYAYGKQWDFDNDWNVGKYFTYWKLSDFWVKGLTIPDMYVDRLRFFLYGGVTVWRNPEDIGNVTIYDNMPTEG